MNVLSLQRDTVLIRNERPANPSPRATRRAVRSYPAFDYLGALYDNIKPEAVRRPQPGA